ncbi:glycosyltransferase [bacterium]|nr:glycosyltransferase [bacterium]
MAERALPPLPSSHVELSIVVPVFNESDGLDVFFDRVEAVLRKLEVRSYEIVCVNDGSLDDSLNELLRHRHRNPAIKVVDLSRNFGKEQALSAGLHLARGQAVVPIDVDLQDPPELIADFVAKWREGYEVVYGVRSRRQEGVLKRITAFGFYRIFDRLAEIDVPADTGDYRLLDRKVVDVINRMPENNRFMKGLFAWVGFRQTGVSYVRPARSLGKSSFRLRRLWRLALDGITSFSTLPLRIWSYIGGGIAFVAFLYALWLIARTMLHGAEVPGYASLMVVMLFLGGLQLLGFGIMGEYLGRLYMEAKRRPNFIIRQSWGVGDGA